MSAAAPVVQLLIRPSPGRRARRRIAGLRRAFAAAGAEVSASRAEDGPFAIDPRADIVVAAGGDGTLRHAIDALHRSGLNLPIAVYPAGTVNLMARERGYARDARAFARAVLRGGGVAHHSALVGDTALLCCASIGPDARAVAAVSPALKRAIGRSAYPIALAPLLGRWPRPALLVACGGERIACEAVYVAKGRYFAGPWSIAPAARADEPWLHVVTMARAGRRDFARLAWAVLHGRPVEALPGVRTMRCREVAIAGEADVPMQIDGDAIGRLPATIVLRVETTRFA